MDRRQATMVDRRKGSRRERVEKEECTIALLRSVDSYSIVDEICSMLPTCNWDCD